MDFIVHSFNLLVVSWGAGKHSLFEKFQSEIEVARMEYDNKKKHEQNTDKLYMLARYEIIFEKQQTQQQQQNTILNRKAQLFVFAEESDSVNAECET